MTQGDPKDKEISYSLHRNKIIEIKKQKRKQVKVKMVKKGGYIPQAASTGESESATSSDRATLSGAVFL